MQARTNEKMSQPKAVDPFSICSFCRGATGDSCVCGGSGSAMGELNGLREVVFEFESKLQLVQRFLAGRARREDVEMVLKVMPTFAFTNVTPSLEGWYQLVSDDRELEYRLWNCPEFNSPHWWPMEPVGKVNLRWRFVARAYGKVQSE